MTSRPDVESRLAAALAARAEQVRPRDLPATFSPTTPPRRRTPRLLAAAACTVLAVGVTVAVTRDDRRTQPTPEPDRPEVVVPPDVGQDWERARLSPPAQLDLDGDGTDEKVRFLGEPSKEYDGRVRLETTLSATGEPAYGVVELGTTIGVSQLDPVDADRDGDQELLLYYSADALTTVPVVLDLRDGVLVEAPPTDPGLLRSGTVAAAGGTEHYDMVRLADYWIEDGTLYSGRSRGSFASAGMSLFRPEQYVMDVVAWRLSEDGVLEPEPATAPCVTILLEGRRPCRDGETDALPALAPVAAERIDVGGSFASDEGYRFTAALEAPSVEGTDADVVVSGGDGRRLRVPLRIGPEPQLSTTPPTGVFYDGASLVAWSGDSGETGEVQVLVQDGFDLVALEPVGPTPLGTGRTEEGHAFRTWLSRNGEVFTAVASTDDVAGAWQVWSWMMTRPGEMVAVPRGTVCFGDHLDPATARRC